MLPEYSNTRCNYIHAFILCVCVFAGYWSTEGCHTNVTATEIICCCNHLSFFAVLLVNGNIVMRNEIDFYLVAFLKTQDAQDNNKYNADMVVKDMVDPV